MTRLTDLFQPDLSEERWLQLYEFARKQGILGVTLPLVNALPRRRGPSLKIYSRWALAGEKLREINAKRSAEARELTQMFADKGLKSCILKGQGSAQYYPDPGLRQCGDIDIWVAGERKRTLSALRPLCKGMRRIVYHHCEPVGLMDGVNVEVHFTPTWMNSFALNRRLQQFFSDEWERQSGNFIPELGFAMPTARFAAVYSVLHILRHVLDEGIGLRQMMDLHYILLKLSDDDRRAAADLLRQLKTARFTSALMFVLQQEFGTPDECLLFAPDARKGAFIADEIMRGGNFGQHDKRNAHSKGENRIRRFIRKTRRQTRFLSLCPREVLAAPAFKLWQYCWRKRNNYL